MLRGLAGKAVLVTGAAGGIGSATARRLSEEGARVVVSDIDEVAAQRVAASLPGEAVGVGSDITTAEGAARGVDAAISTFGRLDLAHVNAGVECEVATIADFSAADYHRVFNVNVLGAFFSAQAAVKGILAHGDGGAILVTSSIAGLQGNAGTAVYNASKHAVLGMARSLGLEVGPLGIRVNTLCPGVVDTRMMRSLEDGLGALAGMDGPAFQSVMAQAVPLGRYASPEEIAATAAWILSDEVPYCHGEVFTVGGGLML